MARVQGRPPLASFVRVKPHRHPALRGRVVRVEGLLPFDFGAFEAPAAMEAAFPRLPSFVPGPGPFRFFGADEARPPFLWASHEAPGLHVLGILPDELWRAWWAAFEEATASWPRRL